MNRTYSLDVMPQEYSTCGVGDFRLPWEPVLRSLVFGKAGFGLLI